MNKVKIKLNLKHMCVVVFESHLMGRRHAAKVKKHAEVTLSSVWVLTLKLDLNESH